MSIKRVASVQDISCFGKCSLTVALPVISAMGVETCIIPTAILSTHTGGFTGYTFRDLTDDIPKIAAHWKSLNLHLDTIYTGYLGSFRQIGLVGDLFDLLKNGDTLLFVDPVMGDNGKLYTGFTPGFAYEMAKLCSKADIIVPNLTEASFMLGEEYIPSGYSEDYIKGILKRLTSLGCKKAVITGVVYTDDKQGAAAYDSENDIYYSYFRENIKVKFHGTGDVFSSAMCGALTKGFGLEDSLKIAVDFTVECINRTVGDREHNYSVRLEECIPYLINRISKKQ